MKKAIITLAACCLLLFSLAPAQAAAIRPDLEEIGQAVDGIFKRGKAVGGSLVIMKDGEIVYARDYGLRDVRSKLPVNEITYFKMGCVTKMSTSLAILQLVEEGVLELDLDISEYFGYKIVNPHFPRIPITIRHLMSHTSSISETGGYSKESNTVYDMLSKDVRRAANFRKVAPGSDYQYSNFASGLLGSIIEAKTGLSFNRFVKQRLFDPLGIDASIAASWLSSPEDVASIYANGKLIRTANKYLTEPYEDTASPETHYRTLVGGLFIRSRDLVKLAAALCGDGSWNGVQLLKPETLQEMRAEQFTLGKSVTGPSPYGLFLEHNSRVLPGHTVYGHQGMTVGSANNVYFEPETGFVFVMTTNGCSMARDHGTIILAQNLLRYTYPLFAGPAGGQ